MVKGQSWRWDHYWRVFSWRSTAFWPLFDSLALHQWARTLYSCFEILWHYHPSKDTQRHCEKKVFLFSTILLRNMIPQMQGLYTLLQPPSSALVTLSLCVARFKRFPCCHDDAIHDSCVLMLLRTQRPPSARCDLTTVATLARWVLSLWMPLQTKTSNLKPLKSQHTGFNRSG